MKNLSISFTLGKGMAEHGSNIQHNNRKFTAKNVDETRFTSNITYKQQYIEDAYNQLFGKALREYNAKQKKECRKINDYYAHIVRGRREEPFYEVIVQFGDCHTAASGTPDGDRVKAMLDEYMKMFQVRNPNLYVFNAVLHDDEASPHLHIDFIPFYTHGRKIGLSKGVSMRAALREMGYVPKNSSVNQLVMWEEAERKFMEELLHRHGYERNNKDAHYPHMTVEQYKASRGLLYQQTTASLLYTASGSAGSNPNFSQQAGQSPMSVISERRCLPSGAYRSYLAKPFSRSIVRYRQF